MRTMLGNQLHALAMSEGLCRKGKLFTKKGRVELGSLTLGPWACRRREELLKLLEELKHRSRSWIAPFWRKPSAAKMPFP